MHARMAPTGRKSHTPSYEGIGVQDEYPKVLAAAATHFFQRMVNGEMAGDRTPPLVGCTVEQLTHQHPPIFDGRAKAMDVKNWIERLEKIFRALFCTNEQNVEYATYNLMNLA